MTVALASSTFQAMSVVFMTVCVTLRALRIINNDNLFVSLAMGSVLLVCSAMLDHNIYLASVMFTIHVVCAALVVVINEEAPLRWIRRHYHR